MEFLLYLTPTGKEILNILITSKFKIQENTQVCKERKNVFGYLTHHSKEFGICTKNIKEGGWSLKHYVNETLYHESVHAAQICKTKQIFSIFGPSPLGIPKKDMPISSDKLNDVQNSKSVFGIGSADREHEAYYLEDKPDKVLYFLKKYCL
jgi:hypothetical protein